MIYGIHYALRQGRGEIPGAAPCVLLQYGHNEPVEHTLEQELAVYRPTFILRQHLPEHTLYTFRHLLGKTEYLPGHQVLQGPWPHLLKEGRHQLLCELDKIAVVWPVAEGYRAVVDIWRQGADISPMVVKALVRGYDPPVPGYDEAQREVIHGHGHGGHAVVRGQLSPDDAYLFSLGKSLRHISTMS